jgi:hypothetical protein
MAQLIETTFTSWKLTEEEQLQANQLTDLQIKSLQTKQAQIAEEKLNEIFNPNNTADYGIQTSYKQGQLDLIRWLLDLSEAATEAHLQLTIETQEGN